MEEAKVIKKYLAHVYQSFDGFSYSYVGNRYVLAHSFGDASEAIHTVLLAEHPVTYAENQNYVHHVDLQEVAHAGM